MVVMKNSLLLTAFAAVGCEASTRIAVLEFGRGGAVRRTTTKNPETTVEGVASFWNALHSKGRRKLQHAGMTVVPDLFHRPDSGVVIGLSGTGMDLQSLPTLSGLVSEEDASVVGTMEVDGASSVDLLDSVARVDSVQDASELKNSVEKHSNEKGLSGVKAVVDSSNAVDVDNEIADIIKSLQEKADSGKTVVLHIVVEEDEATSRRRRLMARRLEDEVDEEEQGGQEGDNNAEDDNANGNNGRQYNGYYGYGYYNAYGEWVTPYKTMFQIQYFNVVLWTAIGLTIALIFTIYLMMYMPLEADTLLFGEQAKMAVDE